MSEVPDDSPGEIGPYRVLSVLGQGGMGTVYVAEHRGGGRRRVALKLLRVERASDELVARFALERRALSAMDHECIAQFLEAGETRDGMPWVAMELIEGLPIVGYCDKHQLSIRARLELFRRVCEGVQHAHQKGVIHRDLKPSNILVAKVDGVALPKILDFGLAKATDLDFLEKTLFTEHERILGTPEYMSPEQASSDGVVLDVRADVYSLGVLLYELLTGTLPFTTEELRRAGVLEALRMLREVEAPRPSQRLASDPAWAESVATVRKTQSRTLRRALSEDLDWVIMRALAKEPERRYGSPAELAEELRRYLEYEPVLAGPPSFGYCFKKFLRRYRTQVIAALLIFVSVLGGGIASFVGFRRASANEVEAKRQEGIAKTQAERAEEKSLEADEQRREAERGRAEAEYRTHVAALAAAQLALETADVPAARRNLLLVPEALRGWEWQHLYAQLDSSSITLFAGPSNHSISQLSWNHAGDELASASTSSRVVQLWDPRTGDLDLELDGHEQGVTGLDHHPSRDLLATTSRDRHVRLWNTSNGERVWQSPRLPGEPRLLCFCPNGERIYVGTAHGRILVIASGSGSILHQLRAWEGDVSDLTVSADAAWIAACSYSAKRAAVWSTHDWKQRCVIPANDNLWSVSLSQDGGVLFTGGFAATNAWRTKDASFGWWYDTPAGGWITALDPFEGRLAIATDHGVGLYEPNTAQRLSFSPAAGRIRTLEWSPDGRALASGGWDGVIRIWHEWSELDPLVAGRNNDGASNRLQLVAGDRALLSTSLEREPRVIDRNSGRVLLSLQRKAREATTAAASDDLQTIVTGSRDGSVLLHTERAAQTRLLLKAEDEIRAVAFDPHSGTIVAGDEAGRCYWFVPPYSSLAGQRKLHSGPVYDLRFTPDGQWLFSGSQDGSLAQLRTEGLRLERRLLGHRQAVFCLAISADSQLLASGSADATARIWRIEDGELLHELKDHTRSIKAIAFNRSSSRLATGSWDGTVKLWELDPARLLLTFRKPIVGWGWSLLFAEEDRDLLSSAWANAQLRTLTTDHPADPIARPYLSATFAGFSAATRGSQAAFHALRELTGGTSTPIGLAAAGPGTRALGECSLRPMPGEGPGVRAVVRRDSAAGITVRIAKEKLSADGLAILAELRPLGAGRDRVELSLAAHYADGVSLWPLARHRVEGGARSEVWAHWRPVGFEALRFVELRFSGLEAGRDFELLSLLLRPTDVSFDPNRLLHATLRANAQLMRAAATRLLEQGSSLSAQALPERDLPGAVVQHPAVDGHAEELRNRLAAGNRRLVEEAAQRALTGSMTEEEAAMLMLRLLQEPPDVRRRVDFVSCLGAVSVRSGEFARGLVQLLRVDSFRESSQPGVDNGYQESTEGRHPGDVGFLLMGLAGIGQVELARSFLSELEQLRERPLWRDDEKLVRLVAETRDVLAGASEDLSPAASLKGVTGEKELPAVLGCELALWLLQRGRSDEAQLFVVAAIEQMKPLLVDEHRWAESRLHRVTDQVLQRDDLEEWAGMLGAYLDLFGDRAEGWRVLLVRAELLLKGGGGESMVEEIRTARGLLHEPIEGGTLPASGRPRVARALARMLEKGGKGPTLSTAELQRLLGEFIGLRNAGRSEESYWRARALLSLHDSALGSAASELRARILAELSISERTVGQAERGLRYRQAALDALREIGEGESLATAWILHDQAWALRHDGRLEESIAVFQRELELRQRIGEPRASLAFPLVAMAYVYEMKGLYRAAHRAFRRGYEYRREELGPTDPQTLESRYQAARMALRDGTSAELATRYAEATYAALLELRGAEHGSTAGLVQEAHDFHVRRREWAAARRWLLRRSKLPGASLLHTELRESR